MNRQTSLHLPLRALAVLLTTGLPGCFTSADSESQDVPRTGVVSVYVVNYPLQYFAERIGGDQVQVTFPAPPDEDPAFWMPDAETIAEYQNAELILLNGAAYAKWVDKVSLPRSILVNTSAAFADQLIASGDSVTHSHGPSGDHTHGGTAFTTWLDPLQAVAQAKAIMEALAKARPQQADVFRQNFESLQADLEALDQQLVRTIKRPELPLVFSHPVYEYLTRRYKLDARSMHWEPDMFPSEARWAEFDRLRQEHPTQWMIWEGTPDPRTVDALRERGVSCVVFDPVGNTPERGDYLARMRTNVEQLAEVYMTSGDSPDP